MTDKTLIERLRSVKRSGSYADSVMDAYGHLDEGLLFDDLEQAADALSQRDARIAELEQGFSKIADGRLQPNKEGHYLAHREAVRIARALLSPAVEGGGGERNMASRELSTTTNAAPSASGLADPTSSGAE